MLVSKTYVHEVLALKFGLISLKDKFKNFKDDYKMIINVT